MSKIISEILNWPVIVQGIIGSLLFWVLLTIGQKMFAFVSKTIAEHSKKRKIAYLHSQFIRYKCASCKGDFHVTGTYATILLFRAAREIVSGLILFVLGVASQGYIAVFSVIGYCGCLYYLFSAIEIVKPIAFDTDVAAEMNAIQSELERLQVK